MFEINGYLFLLLLYTEKTKHVITVLSLMTIVWSLLNIPQVKCAEQHQNYYTPHHCSPYQQLQVYGYNLNKRPSRDT